MRKELDERMGAARAAGEQVDGSIKETLKQVGGNSQELWGSRQLGGRLGWDGIVTCVPRESQTLREQHRS
jgi:hypothetical protein